MKFRPCIDIHNGAVKQIVGGSLKDEGNQRKNMTSTPLSAAIRAAIFLSSFSVKMPHSRSFLSRITIP